MEDYKIVNFNEIDSNGNGRWVKTEINGEIFMVAQSVTVEYSDGRLETVTAEQLDRIIIKHVATGNYISIPKSAIENGEAASTVWYTGYAAVSDSQQHVKAISSCNSGILIVNNSKKSAYAGSSPEAWDALIDENDALLDWVSDTYGIDITANNTAGTSIGDAPSMHSFLENDRGICCILGASDRAQGSYHPGITDAEIKNNDQTSVASGGYVQNTRAFYSEEEYQKCAGRTFFIFQNHGDEEHLFVKKLVEHKANVYFFQVDGNAHMQARFEALEGDLYDAISGDEAAIEKLYNEFKPVTVRDITNVDEEGNYVWEEVTLDEFKSTILSELATTIQLTQLKINEGLKNALSAAGEDTLLTTLETVAHRMNNIRGIVNAYTEVPNGGFHSTAVKKLADYINKYAGMYSIYASKISAETAGILSNAEGIVAMDEDLDDLVARQLSDDYHGTNLVSEAGISTPSESTSADATTNISTKEGSGIDYSSLNASQLKADTAERITNDLKYHDEHGNVLETPLDDTEVLLKFLEKEGYDLPSSITIKNILTTDACAEYCNEKGYSNPTENGLYAQLEFVIRESDSLSQIKNIKSDTLSHTMRAKAYNLGKNIFEKDEKYMSDLWVETLYNQCMADYKEK